jgi:hypothetical protein
MPGAAPPGRISQARPDLGRSRPACPHVRHRERSFLDKVSDAFLLQEQLN